MSWQPPRQISNLTSPMDTDEKLVRGERGMWRAVLTQALQDAKSKSRKPEDIKAAKEARAWLLSQSQDFETVCDYGDIDPDYVHSKVKIALANGCEWRLPNGQGWRTKAHREALARLKEKEERMAREEAEQALIDYQEQEAPDETTPK